MFAFSDELINFICDTLVASQSTLRHFSLIGLMNFNIRTSTRLRYLSTLQSLAPNLLTFRNKFSEDPDFESVEIFSHLKSAKRIEVDIPYTLVSDNMWKPTLAFCEFHELEEVTFWLREYGPPVNDKFWDALSRLVTTSTTLDQVKLPSFAVVPLELLELAADRPRRPCIFSVSKCPIFSIFSSFLNTDLDARFTVEETQI